MKKIFRNTMVSGLILAMTLGLLACGSSGSTGNAGSSGSTAAKAAETAAAKAAEETAAEAGKKTGIQVFVAASMKGAMQEIADGYHQDHPQVEIAINADSSGKLMTQIREGAPCDIFFSAAEKQMDTLADAGLVVDGTRTDLVGNTLCVVTYKDSGTRVTGLKNIGDAQSIALADGSVPVGRYTREAMVNAGMLEKADDVSKITTQQISDALGGVEISEQGNVSKVLAAVEEHSSEVGTTYYSDTYHHPEIVILEQVSEDLTGPITYPIAQIVNKDADDAETAAAADFLACAETDTAKKIYRKYQFLAE
jgi:molybdate transport system substrate-binding protein